MSLLVEVDNAAADSCATAESDTDANDGSETTSAGSETSNGGGSDDAADDEEADTGCRGDSDGDDSPDATGQESADAKADTEIFEEIELVAQSMSARAASRWSSRCAAESRSIDAARER